MAGLKVGILGKISHDETGVFSRTLKLRVESWRLLCLMQE